MTSKTNLKCKFREIILGDIIPELAFRRAVGMMLPLIKCLSHPIGLIGFSYSWWWNHDKILQVRSNETDVSSVISLPDFDWSITTYKRDSIDVMTVVQCIDMKKHKTFGDLASDYYWNLVHCFTFANSVADIFDRYDITKSITSAERERRSKVSAFSAQENKQALINVFGTYLLQIVRNDQVVKPGHTLYVVGIFGNPEVVNIFFRADRHWLSWIVQQ